MPAATEMIMATLPPARAGVGSAVNDTVREFGGALGVAVIGSIAATSYATSMHDKLDRLPDLTAIDRTLLTNNVGAAIHASQHLGAQADQIATAARDRVRRLDAQLAVDRRRPRVLRRGRDLHPAAPPGGEPRRSRGARQSQQSRRIRPWPSPSARRDRRGRNVDGGVAVMTGTSAAVAGDVIVVGGGAAGITAALVLARARHRVTVLDDQTHRNATVDEFHGFPTRDATAPNRFRADALAELHAYGVSIVRCAVTEARSTDTNVSLSLADGTSIHGDAVVLATGVHDELPPIDGSRRSMGQVGVQLPVLRRMGAPRPARRRHRRRPRRRPPRGHGSLVDIARHRRRRVRRRRDSSAKASRCHTWSSATEPSIPATAAFLKAPVVPRSAVARDLGCNIDDDGYIVTTENGATSNPLVWAAGDVRRPPPAPHQVVLAAADGSAAAIAIHKAFVAHALGSTTVHPALHQ